MNNTQFADALMSIYKIEGEHDRPIIYFSGHGDVEENSYFPTPLSDLLVYPPFNNRGQGEEFALEKER